VRLRSFIAPLASVAAGLLYGLFARYTFDTPATSDKVTPAFTAVTLAYLFLVPFALGVLTTALGPRDLRPSAQWLYWLLMPWVSGALLVGAVLALAWEGAICLFMAAPLVLAMSMLGGIAVGVYVTTQKNRPPPGAIVSCLVLPFILAPAEARLPPVDEMRTVTTVIDIDAPPETVWRNVVRVPRISEAEQRHGFFQVMGIPRPLEATLSHDGVGGLREAKFAGGIEFHERVTEWEPGRRLGFTITADAATIANDVLDYHVRVGGAYFDVVYGEFFLTPQGTGTRLRLLSRHRLSTHFNFYSSLWTDAVMQDIQTGICRVIRSRSEQGSTP
jgi:uncharacterized protein YndB with AHSA1/START domain